MAYLIQSDYKKLIGIDNLLQVIGQDTNVLNGIELTAQAELVSYLVQKYDTTKEFTDTTVWSNSVSYKAGQRVYLDATAYNAATIYVTGDLTLQAGNVYRSISGNTAGAFNAAQWTFIGAQYKMFFVSLPFPLFDLYANYVKGTQVWYGNKTYTAILQTSYLTHDGALQYGNSQNIPPRNIFPNNPVDGLRYWGAGTVYALAAGVLPTASGWTTGDNRSQQLVTYMIDLALYHVHSRIAPRNIPDLRVKRRDEAIAWLKMAGRGEITPNLPILQPLQGNRIRYATDIKSQNNY